MDCLKRRGLHIEVKRTVQDISKISFILGWLQRSVGCCLSTFDPVNSLEHTLTLMCSSIETYRNVCGQSREHTLTHTQESVQQSLLARRVP